MRVVAFDMGKKNFAWAVVDISTNIVERFDLVDLDETTNVYRNLHTYLLQTERAFMDCGVILVEQQMKTNYHAMKLSQHVMAFFYLRSPEKTILEWSASHKTSAYGLEKTTKSCRKRFAVEKVRELLENDPVVTDLFEMLGKKDDVADCILMCFSFAIKNKKKAFNKKNEIVIREGWIQTVPEAVGITQKELQPRESASDREGALSGEEKREPRVSADALCCHR